MSRKIVTYLLLMFGLATGVFAQADTLKSDIELEPVNLDTMRADTTVADTVQAGEAEPAFKVIPWRFNHSIDSYMATNDSLLRWQNWPDWTHKKNRDPGVITYRLGTVGRSNALLLDAHEPRHQNLFWEEIPMHDPVSGAINWNVIPIHKVSSIYEDGSGITHQTNFHLKQYYVNKPMSKLIFDESKFNRRALEFWITQNFTQKLNAEVSYWDRRGGGGFSNSSFQGSQIFGRVYYQKDNQQLFKLRFLNGRRTLGEPFGYVIPDLNNYGFDRFATSPNQSGAQSETGLTTLALSYHRRAPDTTAIRENFRAGLYLNTRKREVTYSADTTSYNMRSYGAYAHKWVNWRPFKLDGLVRYELFTNTNGSQSAVNVDNWSLLSAEGTAALQPVRWWNAEGTVQFQNRDDGFSSYSIGADSELNFWDRVRISVGASRGELMPTVQQLYWNSEEYSGTPDLTNERIEEAHGNLEVQLFSTLAAGVKGQLKRLEDGIMMSTDSSFVNVDQYNSLSATGYLDFETTHFEISGSATLHRYSDVDISAGSPVSVPNFSNERIWLKGSAYWKGYLFDRATYVKAGLAGMLSPQIYLADDYNTALDFWQPASNDQLLPWYSRLDVDISARVRNIMFVLRFENVLDDVSQLGYFETANYPMPPRRFLFGVRALFSN